MIHSKTAAATLLALSAGLASGEVQPGELILTYPAYSGSSIEHYSADGTVQGSISGVDSSWISSALMPDGRWVVHNNSGTIELRFYTAAGLFQKNFPIPVANYSSDIAVFSDGVIAISSRGEGVLLYDEFGVSHGAIQHSGMMSESGLHIDYDDTIWIADKLTYPGNSDGMIWHLDRNGTLLDSFATPFDAADVDLGPDGTVWVCGRSGQVANFDRDGTVLHQFDAVIDSSQRSTWSLAVGDDGLVWISGHYDSKVRGYAPDGTVVLEFDTTASGNSTYSFIVPGSSWIKSYCFGDGATMTCPCGNAGGPEQGCGNSTGVGAILAAAGSADATADNLHLSASNMIANQPVILFSAKKALNGGNGKLFGDGLRCAGGGLVRLGVMATDGSGGASFGPGLRALGGWDPGDVRYFQAWYGDVVASPCGTGFNFTNGVEVTFLP